MTRLAEIKRGRKLRSPYLFTVDTQRKLEGRIHALEERVKELENRMDHTQPLAEENMRIGGSSEPTI